MQVQKANPKLHAVDLQLAKLMVGLLIFYWKIKTLRWSGMIHCSQRSTWSADMQTFLP
jgi:hypothetical protein